MSPEASLERRKSRARIFKKMMKTFWCCFLRALLASPFYLWFGERLFLLFLWHSPPSRKPRSWSWLRAQKEAPNDDSIQIANLSVFSFLAPGCCMPLAYLTAFWCLSTQEKCSTISEGFIVNDNELNERNIFFSFLAFCFVSFRNWNVPETEGKLSEFGRGFLGRRLRKKKHERDVKCFSLCILLLEALSLNSNNWNNRKGEGEILFSRKRSLLHFFILSSSLSASSNDCLFISLRLIMGPTVNKLE